MTLHHLKHSLNAVDTNDEARMLLMQQLLAHLALQVASKSGRNCNKIFYFNTLNNSITFINKRRVTVQLLGYIRMFEMQFEIWHGLMFGCVKKLFTVVFFEKRQFWF